MSAIGREMAALMAIREWLSPVAESGQSPLAQTAREIVEQITATLASPSVEQITVTGAWLGSMLVLGAGLLLQEPGGIRAHYAGMERLYQRRMEGRS